MDRSPSSASPPIPVPAPAGDVTAPDFYLSTASGLTRRTFLRHTVGAGLSLATASAFVPRARAASAVTLTYWHGWTGDWTAMVKFVVDMFHARQSRVRINPVVVPWDQFVPKLTAAIAAGKPPDIVTMFGSAPLATLAAQGALVPLDGLNGVDLARAEEWCDPKIFQLGRYGGKTYALPYWAGDYCLLCNRTHFREAGLDPDALPQTVADLASAADRLTKRAPDGGIERLGYLPHSDPNQPWLYGTVFGSPFYDPQTHRVTADDPRMVAALEWFQGFPKRFGASAVAAFAAGLSSERAQNLDPFVAGKLSMMMQGPWKLGDLGKYGRGLDFGVVMPPRANASEPQSNWTWGDLQAIPKGSKDPAAAAEFILFTAGVGDPEGYAKRVVWGGRPINVPVSRSVLQEPSFQGVLHEYPAFQTYVDGLLNSPRIGSPPVMAAAAYYNDRLQSLVQRVQLLQVEPKAGLEALTADVQRQLETA